MFLRKKFTALLMFCVWIVLLAGCSSTAVNKPQVIKETKFLMDTIMEITAYGPNANEAINAAFAEIQRIDTIMNMYDANSEAAKINANAGIGPVAVSPDMMYVLERSEYHSRLTDGVFDVTIGPLTTLWGIGKKGEYIPTAAEIKQAQALVDYRNLVLDKEKQTAMLTKSGMMIDLGSVGKGYAVDRAIEVLRKYNINSALVNAGGSIRVIGKKPDDTPWRIGIQHPRQGDGIIAKIALTEWDTLDTSGDYQRFFEKDGKRYHHMIDPRTGMPSRGIPSNTIAMNNALDADILSTALAIIDVESGARLLQQFPGADAIWALDNGQATLSPGLQNKAELTAGR